MKVKVTPRLAHDHPTGTFRRAGFRFVCGEAVEIEVNEEQFEALEADPSLDVKTVANETSAKRGKKK